MPTVSQSEISFNRKEITTESTQVRHHEAWNKGKVAVAQQAVIVIATLGPVL